MDEMLSLDPPIILRLPQLLKRFAEGVIMMPRFQRGLVWKPEQRRALLDSVWQGIPMGSVFVWRTSHRIPTEDPFASIGPPSATKRPRALNEYLLDGLQRVTTLFSCLGPSLVGAAESPGDFASAIDESEWPAFFDLETQEVELGPKRGGVPETWLPMALLLDAFALIRFQRRLSETMGEGENVRLLINRSELLAERFKDYAIPVIYIVTDDIQQATTSFKRVNSGGTEMGVFSMVRALAWSTEFDLEERADEMTNRLRDIGWHELSHDAILNVVKAIDGMDLYRTPTEKIGERLTEAPDLIDDAEHAIRRAAVFLGSTCDVYGSTVLPYMYQLVLVAMVHKRGAADLNEQQTDALRRWFELTSYTQFFSGISEGRLAKTARHLGDLREPGFDPRPDRLPTRIHETRMFRLNWVRSRLIARLMARQQPLVAPGCHERSDPKELAQHGKDAFLQLFSSREVGGSWSSHPANFFFVLPRHTDEVRTALRDEPAAQDPEFLRRHLIEDDARAALVRRDWPTCLEARAKVIARHEREAVEQIGLEYFEETGADPDNSSG